jgi:iron-sulfur cluster repair protein YtfE (RIC family)
MANKTRSEIVDILTVLTEQHEQVDELFAQLESGKGDRTALFAELADKLAAHAASEEKVFYPAVMRKETSELLHESVEEHLAIKRVLADMLELDPDSDKDEFDAKLSVVKEQVSHHAHEEEEDKLFPILRKAMSKVERADLASQYLAMFETLVEEEPRRNVPGETTEAAPLPPG